MQGRHSEKIEMCSALDKRYLKVYDKAGLYNDFFSNLFLVIFLRTYK